MKILSGDYGRIGWRCPDHEDGGRVMQFRDFCKLEFVKGRLWVDDEPFNAGRMHSTSPEMFINLFVNEKHIKDW